MVSQINEQEIVRSLDQAVGSLDRAVELGYKAAPEIDRIYIVSCGSGFQIGKGIQYWADTLVKNMEVRSFQSAELVKTNPPKLNGRTLVLLVSKSGKTPETLEAAEFVQDRSYKTIVFTKPETSPLASKGDETFFLGETAETFLAIFMLMQTIVGAVFEKKENWTLLPKLVSSFRNLPKAFISAAVQNEAYAKEEANAFNGHQHLYLVASGPCEINSNVFGPCILTEMLKVQTHPIMGSEFFHSTLEIVNANTSPILLILGEDPSRPLMERVRSFCKKYAGNTVIYDSRDYAMEGVDPEIRPIVAPYVIQAALKRISVHLAEAKGMNLAERTYMGKIKY